MIIPLHRRVLGKLPAKIDPRTIRYSAIRRIDVPTSPICVYWQTPIGDWGVMGNDKYGNCVIATAGHMLLSWRANELGDLSRITDEKVIELSRQMGATDGYYIIDRLKYWRNTGMWGDQILAFAAIDPQIVEQVKEAINIFGGVDIGLALPDAWQNDQIWDIGNGRSYKPYTWGGHSVPLVGYDDNYVYCVTWGEIQKITWAALSYYCDEAYAVLDKNWYCKDNVTPSLVDQTKLDALLKAIASDDLKQVTA